MEYLIFNNTWELIPDATPEKGQIIQDGVRYNYRTINKEIGDLVDFGGKEYEITEFTKYFIHLDHQPIPYWYLFAKNQMLGTQYVDTYGIYGAVESFDNKFVNLDTGFKVSWERFSSNNLVGKYGVFQGKRAKMLRGDDKLLYTAAGPFSFDSYTRDPIVDNKHNGKEVLEVYIDKIVYTDFTEYCFSKQVGGSHYDMPISPLEFIMKNDIPFVEGNIIKYVCRYKKKNGLEDLKKAQHYLQTLIDSYDN